MSDRRTQQRRAPPSGGAAPRQRGCGGAGGTDKNQRGISRAGGHRRGAVSILDIGTVWCHSSLMPSTLGAIMHNAQMKVYPDGSGKLTVFNRAIIRESGFEERRAKPELPEDYGSKGGAGDWESIARARRRARAAVEDLARSNDFRYFVTLTLDAAKIGRYDDKEVIRRVGDWLKNRVKRNGLAYVLVPERHKDGAIHFHGLFNDVPVVDSGTIDIHGRPRRPRSKAQRAEWIAEGGHIVYNIPLWTWGFSTAIELYGDRRAAIGYVCKYIGKDSEKIGGRWYYSGGALRRPVVYALDCDYDAAAAEEQPFTIDALNCSGVKIEIDGGLTYGVENG